MPASPPKSATHAASLGSMEPFRQIRKTSFTLEHFHRMCTREQLG